VRWGRAALIGAGVAAVVGGTAYVAERSMIGRWRMDEEGLVAAGRSLPGDLQHHFVAVDDGGRIHVVEHGQGPPLVLVHGVMLGVAVWAPQLHQLAHHHRVIVVGQRGHGQSMAGEDGYSMDRLAKDLLAVLDQLDVRGAVLVGHSMGGMVAQLAAVDHWAALAARVSGLALVATTCGPLVPGPGGAAMAVALTGGARRALRRNERRGSGVLPQDDLRAWATRMCFGLHPSPADIELTRSMIAAMSPSAMADLLEPLLAFDVRGRIGAIDLPTEVVAGARDVLTPPRMAEAIAARIPGADLTVFPGCGHMVMLERAEELDDLLHRFADRLARRKARPGA